MTGKPERDEPFDAFVRRITPGHAHLILAECERLTEAFVQTRAELLHAERERDHLRATLVAIANMDPASGYVQQDTAQRALDHPLERTS